MEKVTINASGQQLGRIASQAATILIGKHKADYMPNMPTLSHVTIEGISSMKIDSRRDSTKVYTRYSGYPGGFYKTTQGKLVSDPKKGPKEALRRAISRMLPKNTWRDRRLRYLTLND
jgi:large subunit ribosomal protein L13